MILVCHPPEESHPLGTTKDLPILRNFTNAEILHFAKDDIGENFLNKLLTATSRRYNRAASVTACPASIP